MRDFFGMLPHFFIQSFWLVAVMLRNLSDYLDPEPLFTKQVKEFGHQHYTAAGARNVHHIAPLLPRRISHSFPSSSSFEPLDSGASFSRAAGESTQVYKQNKIT
jgi:hypothetical protein